MCIDFPGQVIERDTDSVIVESAGRRRRASTLLYPDVAVGEWVLVAAGTVVQRVPDSQAAALTRMVELAQGVIR